MYVDELLSSQRIRFFSAKRPACIFCVWMFCFWS